MNKPGELILHPFRERRRQRERQQTIVRARYAGGMVLGLVAVHWTKKLVKRIPGVNILAIPILDMVPTAIIGPALGAAVVYGVDQGDITAARHKVKEVYRDVSRDVNNAVRDLRMDILEMRRRQAESIDRLLPELEQQVTSMERQATPALEKYYAQTQRQVAQLKKDLERGSTDTRLKLKDEEL
ncbi:hypothetical protein DUNSADRAFT_10660 [Dunaliella salina]|uniref:Uncharacterized protein n=1 Tax=Dunaliella salina TaxID=3046 RepID=A0ABQ7GEV9_DUNSA|nr:hypothetical protein DUNSADRAFT_10660 [Dunaliella salina]|eukprot:KAF5833141.1 hypothetical protein DUNSADRAFT_10660 [Dunaliella salina]